MPTVGWTINHEDARRFRMCKMICDNSWMINLKTEEEDVMMDAFLKGFGDDLKKQWEGKQTLAVDVSDELKDLLNVYTNAEDHLRRKKEDSLKNLTHFMKRYLHDEEEYKKVVDKLESLKSKINPTEEKSKEEDGD